MSENTINKTEMYNSNKKSVWYCTLRLTLNLLSHILISFVVLVCLWYSCRSSTFSVLELHIVFCVLGYQFFMYQGILVLSKFNSWSLYIKMRHRRSLHWFSEIIGTILIVIGTIEIIQDKRVNFNTTHGILGLLALITTLLSVLNGMITSFAIKLTCPSKFVIVTKWIHRVTGIGTLFLSAASLHYGFEKQPFKKWIDSETNIRVLKIFTWLFSVFVGIEFWVMMGQKISYKINLHNV